jgi:hypothetical protein
LKIINFLSEKWIIKKLFQKIRSLFEIEDYYVFFFFSPLVPNSESGSGSKTQFPAMKEINSGYSICCIG